MPCDSIPCVARLRSVLFELRGSRQTCVVYVKLLGGRKTNEGDGCHEGHLFDPSMKLAFQRVDAYITPVWPDGVPQQVHLDVTASDMSALAVPLGRQAAQRGCA
jgi:hypothetical protein